MQNLELYTTPLRKFYATVKNLDAFFTELIEAKANTLPQNDRTVEYAQLLYNILMAWFDLAMLDKDTNRATAKAVCKKVQAEYGDGGMSQEERLKAIANIKDLASSLLWGASDKAQAKDLKDLLDAANLAANDIIKKGAQGNNSGSTNSGNAVVKPHVTPEVPDNTTSTVVDMSKPKTSVVDDHNNTTLPNGNNMPENTTTTNQGNTKPVVNDNDEGTVVNLDNYKYVPADNNGNKTDTAVDDKGQTVANIVVYYDKAKQQKQKFKISIKDLSNIKKLSFLNLATNELKEIEPANTITVNIPQSTIEQKISFMVNGEEYTRLYVAALWPQEVKANGGKKDESGKTENTEIGKKENETPVTPGENTGKKEDETPTPTPKPEDGKKEDTPVTPGENTGKKEDEPAKPETGKEEKPSEDKKEDEDDETIDDDFMKDMYEKGKEGNNSSNEEKHEETPVAPKEDTPATPVTPAPEEKHEETTHETHEATPAQPSTTEEAHTETPVANEETHETTPAQPTAGEDTHVEQPVAPSTGETHAETPAPVESTNTATEDTHTENTTAETTPVASEEVHTETPVTPVANEETHSETNVAETTPVTNETTEQPTANTEESHEVATEPAHEDSESHL
jgi:singapore isolate B (sub-type 7) whole genome shotgun sequence assembly, scaffold_1